MGDNALEFDGKLYRVYFIDEFDDYYKRRITLISDGMRLINSDGDTITARVGMIADRLALLVPTFVSSLLDWRTYGT